MSFLYSQVKCGAVYITEEDKTKKVTKNVISLSASGDDTKKKSSSKYTLAIGSSFGHSESLYLSIVTVITLAMLNL